MIRVLLAAAAILSVMVLVMALGGRPALAFGDAPWCTVTREGPGVHRECVYQSIEACRPHVIGGNRGFCDQNPYYKGPAKRGSAPRHRRKRRH